MMWMDGLGAESLTRIWQFRGCIYSFAQVRQSLWIGFSVADIVKLEIGFVPQ